MTTNSQRILVTGGGTFIGNYIASALLAEGADVTLIVRPSLKGGIGVLAQRARIVTANVWDTASLRGRGRGHRVVIHTVGSMNADPSQGLTHQRLNAVSARNVATMCISDGVPEMILMSAVRAPWVKRKYVQSKREAEEYIQRVGVNSTVVRAPIAYVRGQKRPFFFELMTLLGSIPLVSLFRFRRISPMPVDVLARGVARVALKNDVTTKSIYYAPDLRRLNNRDELRGNVPLTATPERVPSNTQDGQVHPFEFLDDETPFGWTPPRDSDH